MLVVIGKTVVYIENVKYVLWTCSADKSYPEIGNGDFKWKLWTFQQWPTLKMRVRYGIAIVILLTVAYRTILGYMLGFVVIPNFGIYFLITRKFY